METEQNVGSKFPPDAEFDQVAMMRTWLAVMVSMLKFSVAPPWMVFRESCDTTA